MNKVSLDSTLRRQIGEDTEKRNQRRQMDRREEEAMLTRAQEVMLGEQEETNLKDQGRKEVFRRAWKEQSDVKNQERQINDELLRVARKPEAPGSHFESPIKTMLY